MNEFVTPLADIGDKVTKLTMELGMKAFANQDEVGAAAVPYLRVVGHLVYAYFWARWRRSRSIASGGRRRGRSVLRTSLAARFYFERLLPETATTDPQRAIGVRNLMELPAEAF